MTMTFNCPDSRGNELPTAKGQKISNSINFTVSVCLLSRIYSFILSEHQIGQWSSTDGLQIGDITWPESEPTPPKGRPARYTMQALSSLTDYKPIAP